MLKACARPRDEIGQSAVEYTMVVALVAIALVLMLAVLPFDPFGSFWTLVRDAVGQ